MTIRGLVLFPGAGSSSEQSTLLAIGLEVLPVPTFRFDFPYRRAGRKIPDRTPVLIDCVRKEVGNVAAQLNCQTADLVIGGRSMGGRICTMAVADALDVRAVVCVSYPLHPPKKPLQLRTEHLPRLNVPSLFIGGTRDEFGTPQELREALGLIPITPTMEFIEGGRHDLKGKDDVVAALIAQWLLVLK